MIGFPLFFVILHPEFNTMRYTEVIFRCEPDTQAIRDVLMGVTAEAGFESFVEEDDRLLGYIQTERFDKDSLEGILATFPILDTKISFENHDMEDKDWNEEWEKCGFDPIWIGDKCVIYNANDNENENGNENSATLRIAIDAKMAFGTGTHETTRMIVSCLLDTDLSGKRVIDCGCGTGILGIVAAKLGASEVVSYDIDNWSVENTQHNAELNGVNIEVLEGDRNVLSHVSGLFDIVMANINRNILLDDMHAYEDVMQHNGIMILSGFYQSDAQMLKEKAAELGLTEVKRLVDEDWCCLILRHQ